jgi:hypothetical protein
VTHARTHIRLLAPVAALLALLAVAPGASAAEKSGSDSVGFGVSPMRFDVDVSPGSSSTQQITISNTDDAAATYTFSKTDYQGDKDEPAATPVLLGGELKSDISGYDWIGLPDSITVPAGQTRTVAVKVTAPSGATGGHYAALVVSGPSRSAGNILAQSQIAVLFMMNAGGVPPPDIVITEIQEVAPGKTVTKVRNNGKTDTTPKVTVITKDPVTGKPIRKTTGTCGTILPGAVGECITDPDTPGTTVGDDGSGFHSGAETTSVDVLGEDAKTSAHGELPTEWAGAWTSMLLPLVGLALFAMYFLFLRRRRKDGEEDGDDLAYPLA